MKFFKIIYYIFLGFLGIVALLLIVSVLPIVGNYKVMTVLSGSMEPTIKTGAVVIVKPEKEYKIGDIITFRSYGRNKPPITHRIYDVKINAGIPVYITKGDANNAPDGREVRKREIVGKMLFSIPYIGYAVEAAKKPVGFAFIICVPAAFIIGDEIRKIIAEARKIRSRKQEVKN